MSTQFFCKNRDRAKLVGLPASVVNGIDYLEVDPADQTKLNIYFLHKLPGQAGGVPAGPAISKDNIFIEGGVRVKDVHVLSVATAGKVLKVQTDSNGDFSTYTLKVGLSLTNKDTPPPGFDPQLSAIDFTFKINCPNEFDCKTDNTCPPAQHTEPDIDYLAKDFASLKRLMLDRLSTIMPDWKERNAADLQIVLVELLAYVGDHLSYYQDAAATEAYLNTARRRVSMKRHARLLDYYMHDGCNARAWVQIIASAGVATGSHIIPEGTTLLTNGDGTATIKTTALSNFLNEHDTVVFETLHALDLNTAHNTIAFYTWSDNNCCLPKGATRATLSDSGLSLKPGDVLVFEEILGPTGLSADANKAHRYAVRLKTVEPGIDIVTKAKIVNISWVDGDALPETLCVTRLKGNGTATVVSVARGNIVLADHGLTIPREKLAPNNGDAEERYYPELSVANNTVAAPYNTAVNKSLPASATLTQDPHDALPVVSLIDGNDVWKAGRDLLNSDRFAREFVVETESDGRSYLRFGDDTLGKKPLPKFSPQAIYRSGNGKSGNIGAEALNMVVWNGTGIAGVRNPLPASGGIDPETMEEVRQFAPRAFRTQERAVTAADYVAKTELNAEVQRAAARFYWTGSWYTVYIIIDRKGGLPVDDAFKQSIRLHLEQYRMAGYDLEIRSPVFVPLHVLINVCVKAGYFKSDVKKALLQVFSNTVLADGSLGFFHPDNYTFGQPVYLSAVYAAAMKVTGVASIEITQFKRWSKAAANELKDGLLQPAELEIIRLDNNPSLPENGRLDFTMLSGL